MNDPHELVNLAEDPAYSNVVTEMDSMIHARHPHIVTRGKPVPGTRDKWSN